MLKVVEKESTASLRERMDNAGCVFKFVVLSPESEIEAGESMHRQALIALHEMLMTEAMEWHENLIKDPKYEDYPEPLISWDLENAIATPLSRDEVRHLTSTDKDDIFERLALYACFVNPPYRARFKGGRQRRSRFFSNGANSLG